jgi:AcrR family transcriptional regulator
MSRGFVTEQEHSGTPGDVERTYVVGQARTLLATGVTPSAEAVAAAAGISRSTYYRLAGGSHQAVLREAGWVAEPAAHQKLVDAAAELLGEVGLTGLRMDAVAERAGVSRATLYRLFPGKPELLASLAEMRSPLGALGAILEASADRHPEELLPELVAGATPRLLANRGILRAILAEAAAPEGSPGRAVVSGLYASLARYLRGQMEAGRLRRTEPLAAVQALVGPLLAYSLLRPDFWGEVVGDLPAPEETVAEIVQIWLRGMRPDQPNEL